MLEFVIFNNCYADTVEYCTQAFASNCPITFTQVQPADFCLNPRDSVCFELQNISIPLGVNGVTDTTQYEVNWNNNINNNQETYCFSPTTSGNHTVDFIVFSTVSGANCYREGQMNVTVLDTISGSLNVSPFIVTSTQVGFNWLSVPNAAGYTYNAWSESGTMGSGTITDTSILFNSGFIGGDSVWIDVKAFSLCDTVSNDDDTVVVVAIDTCFIGYLKTPNSIQNACRYDDYILSTSISYPAASDWLIEWFGPVAQGPDKDNSVVFSPPTANTQYLIPFEIYDTAYASANSSACSVRDTFVINVNPAETPNWDVKTEYCITSYPYRIDVDASPVTGTFYVKTPTPQNAVYESNGEWFFDPGIAGLGTHEVVFKVCGDSIARTFTVGDVPCVTTVFNQSGSRPDGIWTTCDGTVYYSDAGKNSVWQIDTNGNRTLLFGDTTRAFNVFIGGGTGINPDQISGGNSGNLAFFRDGHKSFAKTPRPRGLVVIEDTRDIYFADSYNHKIRKYVANTQEIITVAGPKTSAVSSDIPAGNTSTGIADTLARFIQPWGMTMDCTNDLLYFTERGTRKMRSLELREGSANSWPYMVRNVAGFAGGGPLLTPATGLNAEFGTNFESHITMDGDDIYIPDPSNTMIFKYNRVTDTIEPYLPFNLPGYGDGQISFLSAARANNPGGTAIIPGADSIFFSGDNSVVRSVLGSKIDTAYLGSVAGQAATFGADDGALNVALFDQISAMRYSADGYLYVCDWYSNDALGSIRRIALSGNLLDPFYGMNAIFCQGEPQDTLKSIYPDGVYSVIQGDTSVLTQLGVSDTFFFNPIIADTFLLQYEANVGCCPIADTFMVIVLPPPTPNLDSIVFSCDPSSTIITPNTTDSNWTYVWNDSTSLANGTPLGFDDTLSGVGEGTYYLEVTDTASGCVGYDTTIVQIGFSDTLQIVGTNTMCLGDSVILSFDTTGFSTWWWNTGDSTNEIYANASGDYIAFAANGACMTTDTFRVTANSLPAICIEVANDTSYGRWTVGTLAGDIAGLSSGNTNAIGYNARFNQPWDVLHVDGFLYVTEANNLIRRINLTDTSVTTFAGTGTPGIASNGIPRLSAQFAGLRGITYDKNTGDFYTIAATSNALLRIHNDSVFVVAGLNNLTPAYAEGGLTPLSASFIDPKDIDIDVFGNVYITGYSEQVIRKYNPQQNSIFSVAGSANSPGIVDGVGSVARFNWPWGIGKTVEGNFVIPTESHNIRLMTPDFDVSTVAGPGTLTPGFVDAQGAAARFDNPWNVYVCPQGNSYITDGNNAAVRVVDKLNNVTTIAGNGTSGFMDGDQSVAMFRVPTGITANSTTGVMYVADRANNLIRTISRNKTITICDGIGDTLNASCSITGSEQDFYWVNSAGDTIRNTTIIADTAGIYTFHVINNFGCYAFDSVVVNALTSPEPNINLLGPGRDTIYGCQGDTLVLSADSLNFTAYNWTSPTGSPFIGTSTDSIIATDTSGVYVVEVFNAGGCYAYDTIDVVIAPFPLITAIDSNLCFGETYLVDLSTYGLDSVIWNGTVDTNQLLIDSSGTYIYEAFLNGCSMMDTIIVNVGDSLALDINGGGDNLLGCQGDSVLLEATPFGYGSYLWSPGGQTDSAIYVSVDGTYSVTVTDSVSARCIISDTVTVQFVPSPVLGLDTLYVCFGDQAIFSPGTDSLPTGLDSIVWSNGVVMTSDTDTMIITTGGMYYATGYLGSCIDYDSVFVVFLNDIILTPNVPAINCGDDSLAIGGSPTASGGSGLGFIYEWTSSSPFAHFDDSTSSNPIIVFDTSGTYTFTLTVYDSASVSCFRDTTFTFFTGLLPDEVADLGLDTVAVCNDDTVCFDFSGYNFNTIVWILSDGSGNVIGTPLDDSLCFSINSITTSGQILNVELSTIVSVGTGGDICVFPSSGSYVDNMTIYFGDPITIDPGMDTGICPLDTVFLGGAPTASGGSEAIAANPFTYTWTVNTGTTPASVSNPMVTPSDSSGYVLTVVDTVANCSVSDTVLVDVFETPTIDAGTDVTMCAGDTTTLSGVVTPFDNSLVIVWTPNDTTISNSSILTPLVYPTDTATYFLSVTDTIGCAALSDSVTINVNANPIAAFTADTVCADTITTLSSSSIGTLTWSSVAGTQTGSPITYSFGAGGTYNVTLIADNGGCADTIVGQVLVDTIPVVYAGEDTSYCITDTVTLSSAIGAGSVTWTTLSGGSFSNSSVINPTFTPDTTGIDSLNLFVVDGNGCRNSDQIVLTFAPLPAANAGIYTAGCANTGILLSGATGIGSFIWTTSGDGVFDSSTFINPTYNFGPNDLVDGSVVLTLTASSSPCPAVSDTAGIGINPSAEAVITATVSGGGVVIDSLVEIFVDEGVTFDYLSSLNYLADSTGWDINGDGIVDDLNDTYFEVYSQDGSTYLYLYASNEYGCYDWDTVRIDVIGNQVVFIPNVFNPTGNTNPDNNFLRVFGTNVLDNDEFDFKLYNRWGELIFEESSFNIMNTVGWDGIHQQTGELQSLGVYTYTVKGQFRDGTTFEKVGNVTLVR